MSNFDTAWRSVAASVLLERPDMNERFRFSDRVHAGLASARLSRLGANLAVAGALWKAYLIGFVRGTYYEVDTSAWKPGRGVPYKPGFDDQ